MAGDSHLRRNDEQKGKIMQLIHTVILGASGYTGAELLRLLRHHPQFRVTALTGESQAGKPMGEVYPHLRFDNYPALVKHTELDYAKTDLVFCCLPHGTTQPIIASLPQHVRVVDLSADFRLHDGAAYAEWYGHPHQAMALQAHAIYGLTEHARAAIKSARLVANPGCYPTASLLPLLPLLGQNLIAHTPIVIDALSGVSGAGRGVKQEMLYSELEGGASAYGIGRHRHMAEIEQELSRTAARAIRIGFTPHLVPMTRGMLATIHVTLQNGASADDLRSTLLHTYAGEPFVKIIEAGPPPSTHQVRGSNLCMIGVYASRIPGQAILVSAIDNLVKGASGQAIQNANVMFDLPESLGLEMRAVFP
jgi:N-acetyl-gamma-glutamyl-phosphate reductase